MFGIQTGHHKKHQNDFEEDSQRRHLKLLKTIKVSDIKFNDRIRFEMGELNELAQSIKKFGIIHPPVVDQDYNLIAGGRRLTAIRDILKWNTIEVDVRDNINALTRKELELEENLQRKDLEWHEQTKAIKEIHELKQQIHGEGKKGKATGGWTLRDTASAIDKSLGAIHAEVKLAEALVDFPELLEEKNKFQALKRLKQLEEEAILKELASRKVTINNKSVDLKHGDCLEVLDTLDDASIHLTIADPPWGIELDSRSQLARNRGIEYKDGRAESIALIHETCKKLYRVMVEDSHLYLFFGITNYHATMQAVEDAGFELDPIPCIWVKESGGAPSKGLAQPSAYEVILHAWKGRRALNHGAHNVFTVNRPPVAERIHTAQKPVELLEQIILLASDPGDTILDPFGGSGSTVVAAALQGRKGIAIEKSLANYARMREYVNQKLLILSNPEKEGAM